MYPHQTERLTDVLEREGLEALVASTAENVFYVTGFRSLTAAGFRSRQFAVFSRRGTAVVLPALDAASAVAERVAVDHVACFGGVQPPLAQAGPDVGRLREVLERRAASAADALAAALRAVGVERGRVGLDEGAMTPEAWEKTVGHLAPLAVRPAGELLRGARRVKSPYEIESLQRALHIAEEALNAVLQALKPGVSEREAVALYEAEVTRRGAVPALAIVAMGERTWLPAPAPTDRSLGAGDLVRFDVGAVFKGFHGTVARTAALGEPLPRQQAIHEAIQAGLETAIREIRPGITAGDVHAAAVGAVKAAGMTDHGAGDVGHGIGLERSEAPDLAGGDPTPLEPGEVVTIDVPYLELGATGLAVRDTVLVTRQGARPMNRSVHALIALD